jgi:hypothetical protein
MAAPVTVAPAVSRQEDEALAHPFFLFEKRAVSG